MDKKNKRLTIGQFAALHGVNKKTLMWYDEIGLFKPAAVNPEPHPGDHPAPAGAGRTPAGNTGFHEKPLR